MTRAYKDIIEHLRKKKGLSMQEVCGDYISHSSYSRFINKGQTLSVDKLLYILDRMDLSFREAGLFDHVIQTTNEDRVVMAQAVHNGDMDLMQQTAELFASKAKRDYDTYGMMAIQLRLRMGGEIASQQTQVLQDYLFKIQNWDYKEMYLFTFIMNQVESSIILTQVNRLYKRAAAPLYLERNLNLIILLDEAHFEMLKRGQQNQAQDMFDKLTALVINKTFHTVQGAYTINQSLHHLVVKGQQVEDYDKIVRLQRNLTNMGGEVLARRLQMRYEELKPVYGLPEIEWLIIKK